MMHPKEAHMFLRNFACTLAASVWIIGCGDAGGDDIVQLTGAEDVEEAVAGLCTPTVTSVSFSSPAHLWQPKNFWVYGSCLPQTTTMWIDQCDGIYRVDRYDSYPADGTGSAVFLCTPKWSTGNKSGVVKDKPGGTLLKSFTVNVTY
jgi:hypothetical protein